MLPNVLVSLYTNALILFGNHRLVNLISIDRNMLMFKYYAGFLHSIPLYPPSWGSELFDGQEMKG